MPYHLDICAVFRGALVAEGWSDSGPPEVFYRDEAVSTRAFHIPRPDVIAAFGERAAEWGFRVGAILSARLPEHHGICLRFPDGEVVSAPGSKFRSPENDGFDTMLQRFRAASQPGDRVLEIGSRARSGNTYRHLVHPEVEYVGLDVTAGPNVDVVGDAHHLSRHVDGIFDAVFSISVFEHLVMPWMAALEMNRVMKAGALAYIQSHPAWPLHEEPWDFLRFSKDAWDGLFNSHTGFEVVDKGYAMGCLVVPDFAVGGHLQGLDGARSYLLSACLVRKVGPAKVRWDAEAADVYDLKYSHAQEPKQ